MDTRCAGDMRINQFDIGETIAQRRRRAGVYKNCSGPPPERRSTISTMTSSYQVTRMRNLSGGSNGSTASGSSSGVSSGSSTQLDNQYSSTDNHLYLPLDISPFANSSDAPQHRDDSSLSHRKLDRSLSDSDSDRSGNGSSHRTVNSSRYKTELCRPFEESGSCKYGDKCQFAHGAHELRNLARHPKYKTELCRTFHTIGFCPYGPRCHFIHEDDKLADSGSLSPPLSPTGNDPNNFSYCSESTSQLNIENAQINNSLTVNINSYNGNVDLQSLEQGFNSALNLNRQCSESTRNVFNNASTCKGDEYDIFSSITVFNPAEVVVDNAPKPSNSSYSSYSDQVDNYPTYVDTNSFWPSNMSSQSMAPADPFNYSPTGSTGSSSSSGSDSGSSSPDCGGSTESLMVWRQPPMPFDLVC